MKKSVILLLFIFSISLQLSFAQQAKKEEKYSMQRRQEKLRYSSPGDISTKTYSALKKGTLSWNPVSPKQPYKKEKPVYRTAKKSRRINQS